MKKYLFVLLLLASCRSIGYNDVNADTAPNLNLLPALTPQVSEHNLKNVYGRKDLRVNDAEQIFTKEIKNNITSPYGEKKGTITLTLNYHGDNSTSFYHYTSAFTLGLLNLVGYPADEADESLEIEVDILNKKQEIVKRYTALAQNKAYRAMYYGYKDIKTARRKVAAENMKQTMAIVRQKINADADEIKKLLQ